MDLAFQNRTLASGPSSFFLSDLTGMLGVGNGKEVWSGISGYLGPTLSFLEPYNDVRL
jgi:hypothetical protein